MRRWIRNIKKYYWKCRVKRTAKICGNDLKVNGKSFVSVETILGDNVNFNGMKIKGRGGVSIGNNFHSGEDCLMISQNHNFDDGSAIPYDSTYVKKNIVIEDNVWLGDRVIVLGGSYIHEGAIIQAGSVVIGEIPAYAIAGGHPAKVFKMRNVEHYNKLKEQQKFH